MSNLTIPKEFISLGDVVKFCNGCKTEKPISEFGLRTGRQSGQPTARCRKCNNRRSNQQGSGARRDYIISAKNKPCMDCGIEYHFSIMQFDHVRGEKKFNLSKAHRNYSMPQIIEEISKCEVVCANCHAYRTWSRMQ